jgi:hypothetical protein
MIGDKWLTIRSEKKNSTLPASTTPAGPHGGEAQCRFWAVSRARADRFWRSVSDPTRCLRNKKDSLQGDKFLPIDERFNEVESSLSAGLYLLGAAL